MNCRDAIRLMYLYREGEISDTTRREVELHARSCERCARELAHLERGSSLVAELRETEPVFRSGPALGDRILRAVRFGATGEGRASAGQRWTPQERLRFTCTLAAAAIAGLFFWQSAVDVHRIALLEQRLSNTEPVAVSRAADARMTAQALNMIDETGAVLSGPGGVNRFGMREQRQLQDGMNAFFDVLQQNPPGFSSEVQRLREKYPDLWLISLMDGLNERDRQALALQGKALVRDIHELLQPGEHHYED